MKSTKKCLLLCCLIEFCTLQDQRQQVLGQQHANHFVEAVTDYRIARVRCGNDRWEKLLWRLVGPDAHHLRARHHDVSHLQVGDLNGALDNRQGFVVEQFAQPRIFNTSNVLMCTVCCLYRVCFIFISVKIILIFISVMISILSCEMLKMFKFYF